MADRTKYPARKIKLAEGGIVFVLVVGLCVFLGIRFAHHDDPATTIEPVASITLPDDPPAPVDATAVGGTDPAAVAASESVESAIAGDRHGTPPVREILPDVPVFVTYTSAEKTFFEGHYAEAADMFGTYCESHPENAWGHYMRGLALWKADLDEQSAAAFREALALKPDHLKSLVNLARVQLDQAQPEAALASIEQAIEVAPLNTDARRVLGRVYHALDRLDAAADAYLEVLQSDADDAWALNNLALVWIEQDQHERALAPLARAAELRPDLAMIHNNLGMALEHARHQSQAVSAYALAAELGSGSAETNHARLSEVTVPADETTANLGALAALWSVPETIDDPVAAEFETIAATTPNEGERDNGD